MLENLKTVIPALATPLKEDMSFDESGMHNLVKYVQANGMTTLFVLGYAGECLALDRNMRKQVVRTAKQASKPGTVLIAGTMDDSSPLTETHIHDAYESGADLALMTPPNFYPLSQEELIDYFVRVADKSEIPIIIYNCPENQHYLEPHTINELAHHKKIIALKETSDINKIQKMILKVDKRNDFLLLSGEEFIFYSAMGFEIDGFIMGGPGNILPRQCTEIHGAYKNGDLIAAREQFLKIAAFLYELYNVPYKAALPQIKTVLELYGICGRQMIHPVRKVSEEHVKVISDLLRKHGIQK